MGRHALLVRELAPIGIHDGCPAVRPCVARTRLDGSEKRRERVLVFRALLVDDSERHAGVVDLVATCDRLLGPCDRKSGLKAVVDAEGNGADGRAEWPTRRM